MWIVERMVVVRHELDMQLTRHHGRHIGDMWWRPRHGFDAEQVFVASDGVLGGHARSNDPSVQLDVASVDACIGPQRRTVAVRRCEIVQELLALGVGVNRQGRLDERLDHLVDRVHHVALPGVHVTHGLFKRALVQFVAQMPHDELQQHGIVLGRVQCQYRTVRVTQGVCVLRQWACTRQSRSNCADEAGRSRRRVHKTQVRRQWVHL